MKKPKLNEVFILLALALMPLVFWSGSSNKFGQVKLYFSGFITAVYLIIKIKDIVRDNWNLKITPIGLTVIGSFALACLSMLWAVNPIFSAKSILVFLVFVVIYLVSCSASLSWPRIFNGILICASVISAFGIWQTLYPVISENKPLYYPVSTLGNPNFTAEFILPVFMLTIVNIANAGSRRQKSWQAFCGLLFLATILISRSSAAFVAMVIGLAYLLSIWLKTCWTRWSRRRKVVSLIIVSMAVITMAAVLSQTKVGRFNLQNFSWKNRNTLFRYYAYGSTMQMFRDNVAGGVGFNNFEFIYPKYRKQAEIDLSGPEVVTRKAHNELLQWSAETGIVGMTLAVCLIFLLGKAIIRTSSFNAQVNGSLDLASLGFSAGIIVAVVQSLFGFNLHNPASGALFFFMLGQISKRTEDELFLVNNPFFRSPEYLKLAFGVVLFIIAGVGLFVNMRLAMADYHLRRGATLEESVRGSVPRAGLAGLSDYRKAYELNPYSVEVSFQYARALTEKNRIEEGIGIYRRLLATAPYYLPALNNLGISDGMRRRWRETEEILLQVNELDRKNLQALTNLANLYQQTARYDEAIKILTRILSFKPGHRLSRYNLSALLEKTNQVDKAIIAWEEYEKLSRTETERGKIRAHIDELRSRIAKTNKNTDTD